MRAGGTAGRPELAWVAAEAQDGGVGQMRSTDGHRCRGRSRTLVAMALAADGELRDDVIADPTEYPARAR